MDFQNLNTHFWKKFIFYRVFSERFLSSFDSAFISLSSRNYQFFICYKISSLSLQLRSITYSCKSNKIMKISILTLMLAISLLMFMLLYYNAFCTRICIPNIWYQPKFQYFGLRAANEILDSEMSLYNLRNQFVSEIFEDKKKSIFESSLIRKRDFYLCLKKNKTNFEIEIEFFFIIYLQYDLNCLNFFVSISAVCRSILEEKENIIL